MARVRARCGGQPRGGGQGQPGERGLLARAPRAAAPCFLQRRFAPRLQRKPWERGKDRCLPPQILQPGSPGDCRAGKGGPGQGTGGKRGGVSPGMPVVCVGCASCSSPHPESEGSLVLELGSSSASACVGDQLTRLSRYRIISSQPNLQENRAETRAKTLSGEGAATP